MKILYVITKANWGGAQRYVYDLAVAAKERGHTVTVAVGGRGPLIEKLERSGVRVVGLPLRQCKSLVLDVLSFGSLFPLLALIRKERPDLIHVNSSKAGGLGAFAARIAHVPHIVFTAHGWEFNAPRPLLSRIGIRFFSWLTIVLSHTTICVSEAIQRDVRWLPLVSKKLVIIHNGIDVPQFIDRAEARHRLAPHFDAELWIGMVSELHPTKRVEDALRAFSLVAASRPTVGLVVLGEGPERKNLEALTQELRLEKRVRLVGFVADAPEYLHAFDIFLHSSQSEALGLAVLEAGAAALPVVATRVGGIPEILSDRHTGLLVPARNPDALAEAVETFLGNPSFARDCGARLHERVSATFSKKKSLDATFALYQRP